MFDQATKTLNRRDSIKTIGKYIYDMSHCIGVGSSAEVFLGSVAQTGQPVAIKAIDLGKISNYFDAKLIKNEIMCHKDLVHPNIVQVYDQLFSSRRLYIVTEYCEGGNLYDWIHKNGCVPEQMALKILHQIVRAVKYIHDRNIIHRDIKSANMLLKSDFTVKLSDFGFASFLKNHNTQEKFNVGSPLYMSPEAQAYQQHSVKSDTWALGMILYEMLMGRQPFAYGDMKEIMNMICNRTILTTLPSYVSTLSHHILNRVWMVDPSQRADTTELLMLLDQYFGVENQNMAMGFAYLNQNTPYLHPQSVAHFHNQQFKGGRQISMQTINSVINYV